MKRPPMRNCDECRFADITIEKCHCAHGNRSVFVLPGWEEIRSGEWGWMLRCRDFKRIEAEPAKKPIKNTTEAQRAWRVQAATISATQQTT